MAKKSKKSVVVNDNLVNTLTALGTDRSKRSHFQWQYGNINNYQQFEACYMESWLARRICDVIPADMVREWREIKCEKADEIRSEEDRLMLTQKVLEALSMARLYGGSGIVMLTDQPLDKPLDVRKIKKGSLKRLIVLDRWYLASGEMNVIDVLSEDFLTPSTYFIAGAKDSQVHHSHVIRIKGEPLPMRLSMQSQGWGDSSLRQAMECVNDFVASVSGVAESLQEFNIDTISKEGLFDELGSNQDVAILKRFQAWAMMKSTFRVSLLDGDEKFERNGISYSGIADLIETQMKLVAGAAHTPVTKLFGDSAKGLNATGEGDDINYHSFIRTEQVSKLDPALRKLDEVLVRSAIGSFPDDFNYIWKPLDIESPAEIATANKIQAETDTMYLDSGVITVSQIQRNLQAKESYQFDPERIDALEKAENEVPIDEMLGEMNNEETGEPNEADSQKTAEQGRS